MVSLRNTILTHIHIRSNRISETIASMLSTFLKFVIHFGMFVIAFPRFSAIERTTFAPRRGAFGFALRSTCGVQHVNSGIP